jgi:hypothetical protein
VTLHYHGLPLTPQENLKHLAGKHFCISYATSRLREQQREIVLRIAQSLMFDNGAFSAFSTGKKLDLPGFYRWVERDLAHPHWAIMPDEIDGTVEQQREMLKSWPFPIALGAPVWHLGLSFDWLLELTDYYPKVCFGSAGAYWKVGAPEWRRRVDDAFEYLLKHRRHLPWIHGLRMMSQAGKRWPFASVDSVNVARNFKTYRCCPGCMADGIDAVNGPLRYQPAAQKELLNV